MKKVFLISLVFSLCIVRGQENFGIIHSNYATTNVVSINPANGVMSKSLIDINIVGVKAFFNNNLAYISKNDYKFSDVVKGNTDNLTPQYRINGKKSKGFVKSKLIGPAIALSVGDHAFDFHINGVAFANIKNIPNSGLRYLVNEDIQDEGTYTVSNIGGGGLSYIEIGASYSKNILKRSDFIVAGGINFNYLIGIAGFGAKVDNANYTIEDEDDFTLNHLEGEYMYVNPQFNSGKGFSTSLGLTYAKMETMTQNYLHNTVSSKCNCEDYLYKLGVSLIDLGYVNFKGNALYRNFNQDTGEESDLENLSFEDIDTVASAATSSANQTVRNNSKVYLPGAISLQADYRLQDHFYIGGAYVHGFRKGRFRFGVQRPESLSITPRIEYKRFEFALPISLYGWRRPQIGAMLRINNNLIIGTDKIGFLTGKTNVYGADIYVNLKLGLFRSRKCNDDDSLNHKKRRSRKNRGGNGDIDDCFSF